MSHTTITARILDHIKPDSKPYFIRDTMLIGFGIKVNPSGSIKFIAEVKHKGRTSRKTLGNYPILSLSDARREALAHIASVKSGHLTSQNNLKSLGTLLEEYTAADRLKERTVQDYKEAIQFYLSDWLVTPVSSITKEMVEKRFCRIRNKGIAGGKPTYSQATKTMRILSALMNYAMADDLIQSNPVDILKQKRIDRSIKKREHYLPAPKVRELLDRTAQERHPATLAVHLMLHTGLRKNEALRLLWRDIQEIEGINCILIADTKNHRPHYIPVSTEIQDILNRTSNGSHYLFPSPQKKGCHIGSVRDKLKQLSKLIDVEFKCHDLRRTFATRASEVGIDYLMIKRMLNHKTNDITAQYIQWNSRQNLIVMREALEKIHY